MSASEDQVAAAVEAGRGPARAAVDPGQQRRDHRPDRSELEPRRGRGARGLRRQRDRPVPVLQGRGAPDAGRGYGRIVNVASIAGKEGNPTLMPYSASKAAVIAMTKSLAKELAGKGNHHGQRDLAGRHPHRDPRRRRAGHGRVHDLEDSDGPDRDHRRGRRAGPLPGQPGGQLHDRPVLRHQRRPGHILIRSMTDRPPRP